MHTIFTGHLNVLYHRLAHREYLSVYQASGHTSKAPVVKICNSMTISISDDYVCRTLRAIGMCLCASF